MIVIDDCFVVHSGMNMMPMQMMPPVMRPVGITQVVTTQAKSFKKLIPQDIPKVLPLF